MKSITSFLESIGLSATEAKIYLTGLKKPSTVDELTAANGFKRSTAYHALDTLQAKSLAQSKRRKGRLQFTMAAPEELTDYLAEQSREVERQQVALERLLPAFPTPSQPAKDSYAIEQYESIEGVKKIVDKALDCRQPEWRIIAPRQNFFSDYDKDFAQYFLSKRRAHKIKAKTLWEAPIKPGMKGSLTLRDIVTRNPRFLPPGYRGKFRAVIILFDDKIAFVSSLQKTESLLIQSAEFSTTVAVMFDALWDQSKDFLTK